MLIKHSFNTAFLILSSSDQCEFLRLRHLTFNHTLLTDLWHKLLTYETALWLASTVTYWLLFISIAWISALLILTKTYYVFSGIITKKVKSRSFKKKGEHSYCSRWYLIFVQMLHEHYFPWYKVCILPVLSWVTNLLCILILYVQILKRYISNFFF